MKRISTILLTAMLMLTFSIGATAQGRTLKVVKGGKVVFSTPAEGIDHITVRSTNDYVDLGLPSGTMWAKCNLGASKPEDYGDYYGWGCTEPYADYVDWTVYFQTLGGTGSSYTAADCGTDADPLKDYVYPNSKSIAGTKWDAATVKLGENWRMPTLDQVTELINSCSWEWTTENGKHGCKVTGPNGNYIFIPAAGINCAYGVHPAIKGLVYVDEWGQYFCSTTSNTNAFRPFVCVFNSSNPSYNDTFRVRADGQPIRPVYVPTPEVKYVDLDLPSGTKWAKCNLGATAPEEAGNYYGWGCTEPYEIGSENIDWITYFQKLGGTGTSEYDCGTDNDPLADYVNNLKSFAGTQWDAAHAKLGGNWRMPTLDQVNELLNPENCEWSWTDLNGVQGFKVTSKKDSSKSIFLPAAGLYGTYWSSTPDLDTNENILAFGFEFGIDVTPCAGTIWRPAGLSIRPVYVEPEPEPEPTPVPEYVDLGLPSGNKWATFNLGATAPEKTGEYYGWGCSEPYSDGDYVDWSCYFSKLGYPGLGEFDCGTENDPLQDYVYPNNKSISGTKWDVVTAKYGSNWCMPNAEDFDELMNECSWHSTNLNGVDGFMITGPNDNSIFMPFTGRLWDSSVQETDGGYYRSGTPSENFVIDAYTFVFSDIHYISNYDRFSGQTIRPVYKEKKEIEYVDLGLSVKWAACNLGANKPEDYGKYYGWGCTTPYTNGEYADWTMYFKKIGSWGYDDTFCGGEYDPLRDYVNNGTSIAGTKWDAATAKYGDDWHMPTLDQVKELLNPENCDWTWTDLNGVQGFKVTSKINDNSIFLPDAGYYEENYNEPTGVGAFGNYWSSTPNELSTTTACSMILDYADYYWNATGNRILGRTIRPVYEGGEPEPVDNFVDMGLSVEWASCNLGASKPEEYGDHYGWGCTTPYAKDSEYANWETYFGKIGGFGMEEWDCGGPGDPLSEYVNNDTSIDGTEWDPAYLKDNTCHMPTLDNFLELLDPDNCTWEWATVNGVIGQKVTSKITGNHIFLPAAGSYWGTELSDSNVAGRYWSARPSSTSNVYDMYLDSRDGTVTWSEGYFRFDGRSIRPVRNVNP